MDFWSELSKAVKFLQDNKDEIFFNPITWIILVLIAVAIYSLYDVPSKTRYNGLGNVLRQLLQTFLDVFSELINAIRSISGFFNVIRLLLFGKLNSKSVHILINYGIIFLSAASFMTTFSGLKNVLGERNGILAVFISFGVQVSILVCTLKISELYRPSDKNKSTLSRPRYYFTDEAMKKPMANDWEEEFINTSVPENRVLNKGAKNQECGENGKENDVEKDKNKEKNKKEKKDKYKVPKCLAYGFLLMVSVTISSFFSYLFMFNEFIADDLTYDDYFRSVEIVQEVVTDYSDQLNIYQHQLTTILEQYNNNIEEWLDFAENNPNQFSEDIESLTIEINNLQLEQTTLQREIEEAALMGEDITKLRSRYSELSDSLSDKTTEREQLSATLENDVEAQYRLNAYNDINALRQFYANPLYIDTLGQVELNRIFADLNQVVTALAALQGTESNIPLDDTMRNRLAAVFNNYVNLCAYYADTGRIGIDFSAVSEAMNISYTEEIGEEDYRNNTNEVLERMIEILHEVPILTAVNNVWTNENITAPSQSEYLNRIYNIYRDNSGRVQSFERSIAKLLGRNREKSSLARELVLLALAFDLTIAWLAFMRDRKQYNTNVADQRRMVGILFLDDAKEKQETVYAKGQALYMTIGIIGGALCFILYKKNYNASVEPDIDLLSLVFFSTLGLALGLIIYRIYNNICRRERDWKHEGLYEIWKKIWRENISTEKQFDEHVKKIKISEELWNESWRDTELSYEDVLHIQEEICKDETVLALDKLFYKPIKEVLKHIQLKKCVKQTLVLRKYFDKNIAIGNVVSDNVNLPCISENNVKKYGLEWQFSILLGHHLIDFAYDMSEQGSDNEELSNKNNTQKGNGYYILTERFWMMLYEAVLIRITGSRISSYDIEEELIDDEGEDDYI